MTSSKVRAVGAVISLTALMHVSTKLLKMNHKNMNQIIIDAERIKADAESYCKTKLSDEEVEQVLEEVREGVFPLIRDEVERVIRNKAEEKFA